jgi:phosphinothricin tripeptide acetyl hydrolase
MSLEERDRILARLADRVPATDIGSRREGFEALARAVWSTVRPGEPVALGGGGLVGRWAGASAPDRPALLWLHGGAFRLGSSASHFGMASEIAARSGLSVLLLDYRLVPEHPFPAALHDTLGALAHLESLGWPMERVAIGGDSAGGNLAAAAVQARFEGARPVPRACWLISPYLDLAHTGASYRTRRARDRFVNPEDGTGAAYRGEVAARDRRVSPLFGPMQAFPETLLQVGTEEVLHDDAAAMARLLAAHGRSPVFQAWEGMFHIFPWFAPWLEEGRWALAQGATFLRRIFYG